jgi:hypothetical protein
VQQRTYVNLKAVIIRTEGAPAAAAEAAHEARSDAHPSPGLRAGAFRSNESAPIDKRSGLSTSTGAAPAKSASTSQRLKAAGWRGIELGPVELLLNAVKRFFADVAPRAQALQCRALGRDRA